jgi:hypothetical protein
MSSSSSGTGAGDAGVTDGGVPTVTIAQITDPSAPGYVTNTVVKLTGVIATSTKFLASKSASGSCLWGVFLSSPGLAQAAPHTAILALSYGTPATGPDGGKAYCPVIQENEPAGDAFPDDTKPGDVLDVQGLAAPFIPSTCGAPDAGPPDNSSVAEVELGKVTVVTRTSTGAAVPAPYVLTASDAAKLAAGQDATFFGAWGGARVTLENVTAVPQQGMLFDAYGHMLMNDGVQVGDELYYVGAVKNTDACYAPVTYPTDMPTFSAITGFVYLDYCTWSLAPADKCHALVPPSADCASVSDAGKVCTH